LIYQITFSHAAYRQLDDLPKPDQRRIQERVDRLSTNPRPPAAKAIKGGRGILRIRVGDYRIIYKVEDDLLVILVIRIGHRREVYRRIG
jgi:mRNA interferase RelE/StbE